ncbi:MAG: DUF5329 family protein [Thermodesulfobacteriota bacterium]
MKLAITLPTALLLVSVFLIQLSDADVPLSQKPEVEYVLGLVKNSPCRFERNGKLYDGEKAYEHIEMKYEHFRDEITSTETFIEYVATKSMLSVKYYLILCGDRAPVKTADWLLEELKKYRVSR